MNNGTGATYKAALSGSSCHTGPTDTAGAGAAVAVCCSPCPLILLEYHAHAYCDAWRRPDPCRSAPTPPLHARTPPPPRLDTRTLPPPMDASPPPLPRTPRDYARFSLPRPGHAHPQTPAPPGMCAHPPPRQGLAYPREESYFLGTGGQLRCRAAAFTASAVAADAIAGLALGTTLTIIADIYQTMDSFQISLLLCVFTKVFAAPESNSS